MLYFILYTFFFSYVRTYKNVSESSEIEKRNSIESEENDKF